jgi:hypothetical protein
VSTLFPKPYTIRRRDRTLVRGVWTPWVPTELVIQGSVQPLTGKDLQTMEAGSRDLGKVWIYTNDILRKRTEGSLTEADVLVYDDSLWEVIDTRSYLSGLIEHRKHLAEYRGSAA